MIGSPETLATVHDRPDLSANASREASPAPTSKPPEDEGTLVGRIQSLRQAAAEKLLPKVEALEASPPADPREYGFVSEALMKELLSLDAIEVRPDYTQARQARKEAVKQLQGALDRVDGAKNR